MLPDFFSVLVTGKKNYLISKVRLLVLFTLRRKGATVLASGTAPDTLKNN